MGRSAGGNDCRDHAAQHTADVTPDVTWQELVPNVVLDRLRSLERHEATSVGKMLTPTCGKTPTDGSPTCASTPDDFDVEVA